MRPPAFPTGNGGGAVTAQGGDYGAGIGGGSGGAGGTVTISGGTVDATGNNGGAGVGGGFGSAGGTLTMNGHGVAFASGLQAGSNATIPPTPTDISNVTGGILFDGSTGTVYGTVTLQADLAIPSTHILYVPATATLTIPTGKTLINDGTITNEGTVENKGNIVNNGTIDNTDGTINSVIGGITGNGKIDGNLPTYPDPPPPDGDTKHENLSEPGKWTGEDYAEWRINANFDDFTEELLLMPNDVVDPKNYTATEGSTIIRLHADYLKELGNGEHTFRAIFTTGYAETTLTVAVAGAEDTTSRTSTTPKTGTPSNIILWAILSVASATTATATIATLVRRDKKTRQ